MGYGTRSMRWLAVVLASVLISACGRTDYATVDGHTGQFADWRGRWILINYWAVWCKPCLEEIPELNAFRQQHRDSVEVFGVNFDGGTPEQQYTQAKALGILFPVLQNDPAMALGWERPEVLPTTIVIDPEGQLHAVLHGPQTAADLRTALSLDADAASRRSSVPSQPGTSQFTVYSTTW